MLSPTEAETLWKNKKVLVTGAAGFLGNHLCQQLTDAGATTIGIGHFPRVPLDHRIPSNMLFLGTDVQSDEVASLISQEAFDVIFHLAGLGYAAKSVQDPLLDFDKNLYATIRFLETLHQCRFQGLLVYTSSAAIYGQPGKSPITEDYTPLLPISPYGVSKLAAEHYIHVYARIYDLRAVITRLFPLYGPGQRKQVVFDIIRKVLQSDGRIQLLGSGEEVRDFVYVDDAVAALLHIGSLPSIQERVFNICSSRGVTIRGLAQKIVNVIDTDVEINFTDNSRPGDSTNWVGSNELLTSTGFHPKFDLEQGLKLTIGWCRVSGLSEHSLS